MFFAFFLSMVTCETFEMTVDQHMLQNISTGLLQSDMGFLKELIINSIDANKKLAMAAMDDQVVVGRDITIELSDDALTISDGGIGMSKQELQDYMGKLGGSGSRNTAECTGRFGMGFYSSFVAAHEVQIITKKWKEDKTHRFVLEFGSLKYEVDEVEKEDFGTTVVLKLREEFKKQINVDKISAWISANLLDAGIHNLFNVYVKRTALEKEDNKAAESSKVEFMPWTDSKNIEDIKVVYEKVFGDKGTLLHAEKVGFEVMQKNKTGVSVPAYFEILLFFPEIFDMRMFGMENKGEFHFFVAGMKITPPTISTLLTPLSGIVRSSTAQTTSTRENLLNKEDEDELLRGIEKAIVPIISNLLRTDKRDKVISSYNSYVKSASLAMERDKRSIAKKLFDIAAFETLTGTKTVGEMSEADGEVLYYTDVPLKLVKMRNSVHNPNFDNINVPFFFVSGIVDLQLVSMFKDGKKKLRNLFSAEFKEKEMASNPEFEEWTLSFLGNLVSGVMVSKRLNNAPFSVKIHENALSSSFKQMMGENTLEASPFKSMFVRLPVLEYNPECEEFKSLMEVRAKNVELAKNILRTYVVAVSEVSMCDVDDKVGAYMSLTSLCKSALGLPMVSDDDKKIGDDKVPRHKDVDSEQKDANIGEEKAAGVDEEKAAAAQEEKTGEAEKVMDSVGDKGKKDEDRTQEEGKDISNGTISTGKSVLRDEL